MAEIGGLTFKCSGTITSSRRSSSPDFVFLDCCNSTSSCRRIRAERRNNCRNVLGMPNLLRWNSLIGRKNRVFSMDAIERARSIMFESRQKSIPVYMMMPVDSFGTDASGTATIRRTKALRMSLKALKQAGVHGIAVEVWWGLVERTPKIYNWSAYEELFKWIVGSGLKLHVALCFHSNVLAKGSVSLPLWVLEIGSQDGDIFYKDQHGFSSYDYLTLGVDEIPILYGRTALQCYEDFIISFLDKFDSIMGCVIEEVSIGLGPAGELRYPAHPYGDGRWRFPGIGEFQCYDKYMLEDLRSAALKEGKPEWGLVGPSNAGSYNSLPDGIPFFQDGEEGFLSDCGRFFLDWYSGKLIHHADAILSRATNSLKKYQKDEERSVLLVAKIGIMYWWYRTLSHPAELTAGYYNTFLRNGYDPLASMLLHHGAAMHISCLEMMDEDTLPAYRCSPEGLLRQLRATARKKKVSLTGRNSYERYDKVI
ncbi:hypothetical protein V2J09_020509 [Rumex salicifolius]